VNENWTLRDLASAYGSTQAPAAGAAPDVKIIVEVLADDPSDVEEGSDLGLTESAYMRLVGAIGGAGFGVEDVRRERPPFAREREA
jgi:hypothetical protein